jgi:hypothetical protein
MIDRSGRDSLNEPDECFSFHALFMMTINSLTNTYFARWYERMSAFHEDRAVPFGLYD